MFEFEYIEPSLLSEDVPKGSDNLVEGKAKFFIKYVSMCDRDGTPKKTREGIKKFSVLHSITDQKGNAGQIWKDISAKMQSTIYDLSESAGINLYNIEGKFNPLDLNGCTGECMIKMDKGYEERKPKMIVDRYLPSDIKPAQKPSSGAVSDEDDDIPF